MSVATGTRALRLLDGFAVLGCASYVLLIILHKYAGWPGLSKAALFFWTMLPLALATSSVASTARKVKAEFFALNSVSGNDGLEDAINAILLVHDLRKRDGLENFLNSQIPLSFLGGATLACVAIGGIYCLL